MSLKIVRFIGFFPVLLNCYDNDGKYGKYQHEVQEYFLFIGEMHD
ncbi:MAG: hypothetical protein V8S95_04655 [Odoribacter sp.]